MISLETVVGGSLERIKGEVLRLEREMQESAAWVRAWFTHSRVAEETAEAKVEVVETSEMKRNKRKNEVAGVARGWLQTLEQRGIKLEELPERWHLENRQFHMLQPGVGFGLGELDGKVEIGRWTEKRFEEGLERERRGVSMKISYGSSVGRQERIWLIDMDHLGSVTYFSDNYLADGEETNLKYMKFTGEKLQKPEKAKRVKSRQRSEQVPAELIR